MAGFIKLHRGWRNNPVFLEDEPLTEREAWLWLIENAAWKETHRRTGQGAVVRLERGQMHVSLGSLASAWQWSIKRVRGYLERLTKASMVGTVRDKSGTILTIKNYRKYQDSGHSEGTVEGTDGAQLGHTQEEGKERKEDKKGGYAFCGRVIRLVETDLARWRSSYHLLDLPALLQNRDDWLASQPEDARKRWFQSTSSWLAQKQQEAADRLRHQPKPVKVGI